MCTAILIADAKVPKVAIADMIVYKVGMKIDPKERNEKYRFRTPYQFTVYEPDKLAKAAMRFIKEGGFSDDTERNYVLENGRYKAFAYVREGIHSFTNVERAKKHINRDAYFYIGEFIIPKGSKYYENACGNIVSNKIIFKQFLSCV